IDWIDVNLNKQFDELFDILIENNEYQLKILATDIKDIFNLENLLLTYHDKFTELANITSFLDDTQTRQITEVKDLKTRIDQHINFNNFLPINKKIDVSYKKKWLGSQFISKYLALKNEIKQYYQENDSTLKDGVFEYTGYFSNMSRVMNELEAKFKDSPVKQDLKAIHIFLTHTFDFDINFLLSQDKYETNHPNLIIIARNVFFSNKITVDLTCRTTPGYPDNKSKAIKEIKISLDKYDITNNIKALGINGADGKPGLPGYNGGNLKVIYGHIYNDENLNFVSTGGQGGPGQDVQKLTSEKWETPGRIKQEQKEEEEEVILSMDLVIAQSMIKPINSSSNSSSNQINPYQNEKNVFIRKKLNSKDSSSQDNSQIKLPNSDEIMSEEDYIKKQLALQNLIKTANLKLNLYVNNENIKKPTPITVQIYLIFLRVGEIDNVKERFQADAYFEASWEDDTVDINTGFDPRQNWEPEIFIENAVGNLKQDIKYKVEKVNNKTRVYEMRNIKGIFWEKLELWDFPLDIQSLSITITSSRNKNEIKFVPSPYIESTINTNDFQQQQEWNLYSHIETSKKYIYDIWKKQERPCFTISSTISRRPGYFIYNAYMLIFLISALGFVPFSFQYSAPHFRIQTTCLLILSSINFRWIVTQKLPTVSYLTTLDKYAIVA
ncbi:unnamed protein product, partial [Brachionus calyciflorus]